MTSSGEELDARDGFFLACLDLAVSLGAVVDEAAEGVAMDGSALPEAGAGRGFEAVEGM